MRQLGRSGFSLVQVLVSVAIMGILSMAMVTLSINQSRELKAVQQKMNALDLERSLVNAFKDPNLCQQLLLSPSPVTFDSSSLSPSSPQVVTLNRPIYSTVTLGSPPTLGPVLAQAGSDFGAGLRIQSVELVVDSGSGQSFIGKIRLNFQSAELIRPIKPVEVLVGFLANISSPAATSAISCSGISSELQILSGTATTWTCPSTESGGFCDSMFTSTINFSKEFKGTPHVLISPRGISISAYCPCCTGASDQMIAHVESASSLGFTARTSISPMSGSCGMPWDNWSTRMDIDWIAVGPAKN